MDLRKSNSFVLKQEEVEVISESRQVMELFFEMESQGHMNQASPRFGSTTPDSTYSSRESSESPEKPMRPTSLDLPVYGSLPRSRKQGGPCGV